MKLFSAIGKGILRLANDKYAEHQCKKANVIAYKNTGKEMQKAKRNGKRIDGSKTYKIERNKRLQSIETSRKSRENFINDLF